MRRILFPLLGAALVGVDQWTKAWTVRHLLPGQSAALLPGVVELLYVRNDGAAWSVLSGQRWLLAGGTALILAAVAVGLVRRVPRHPLGELAGWLILSGGVGNLMDRLRLGYVVDMLHLVFWPSYPTFNAADICIVTGAVLGAVYYLFLHDRRPPYGHSDPSAGA